MVQDPGTGSGPVNLDEGKGNMLGGGSSEDGLTDIWGARTEPLQKDTDTGNAVLR